MDPFQYPASQSNKTMTKILKLADVRSDLGEAAYSYEHAYNTYRREYANFCDISSNIFTGDFGSIGITMDDEVETIKNLATARATLHQATEHYKNMLQIYVSLHKKVKKLLEVDFPESDGDTVFSLESFLDNNEEASEDK